MPHGCVEVPADRRRSAGTGRRRKHPHRLRRWTVVCPRRHRSPRFQPDAAFPGNACSVLSLRCLEEQAVVRRKPCRCGIQGAGRARGEESQAAAGTRSGTTPRAAARERAAGARRSVPNLRGRRKRSVRRWLRALPLRGFGRQAVVRRITQRDRLSGGGARGRVNRRRPATTGDDRHGRTPRGTRRTFRTGSVGMILGDRADTITVPCQESPCHTRSGGSPARSPRSPRSA